MNIACTVGIASSLLFFLSLCLADWCAQLEAEANIARASDLYADADDPTRLGYLAQAKAYNAALTGSGAWEGVLPYASQLLYREEPMMSHIEIPRIAMRLPIYHGTEENVLMAGAGHWEQSSLPVGGAGTRCVLLGHSGMRNTRMFDDIRKLRQGDAIVVWTLGDPYAYRVSEVRTVSPEELEDELAAMPGADMVTLVTCTPLGVNTHRLVVDAVRCAYEPDKAETVGIEAYVNDRNLPLIVAAVAVAGTGAALLVTRRRREGKASARKEL